ncbi:MAG: N-acetylmuramoyl-L-alanine amidase [Verrucomicrobiota bacterium]
MTLGGNNRPEHEPFTGSSEGKGCCSSLVTVDNQNLTLTERRSFLKQASAGIIGAAGSFLLAPTALAAGKVKTVVIDAGHGGHDVGAHEGRVFEKHLNFDVSRRLQIQLKRKGYRTVMTRNRDEFIPLLTRASISNKYRDNIFVSIHFNSAWRTTAVGIETFYYGYAGYQLASKVHSSIIRKLKPEDRGVKRQQFSVLRNTKAPAILVEGGFISNAKERQRCLQPWYRQALAESIASGISSYDAASSRGRL